MGEAIISRRGKDVKIGIETLQESNFNSFELTGFDFKNNSYFFRLCFMESNNHSRYYYDFIIERGGTISYTNSICSSAAGSSQSSHDYISIVSIDVEQGRLKIDREYSTLTPRYPDSVCVVLN